MISKYKPKTWENYKTPILADDLNHMEKGIENATDAINSYQIMTGYPYKLDGLSDLELEIASRYETARTGKVFATKHYKFAVNTTPMGTKLLDSVGLKCTPSTDKTVGQDDFIQYLPFQWEHVNYVRDEDDGFARPVAIEGRPNYQNTGNVDVGSMSATFWWKYVEDETTYTIYLSDMPHPELGLIPWCEAVKADGSVYPYYIGSSYSSAIADDGLLRSIPDKSPAYSQSHNNLITNYQKKGTGYWGAGTEFVLHGVIFSEIKYATANIQQYAQGCTGYSFQSKVALAETGVKRVLSKSAWGCDVGSVVSVGHANSSGSIDRGVAEVHNVADRVRVKSMETVSIDGTNYYALNLDVDATFDTDVNTYVSSMPCYTGETDAVVDRYDGSVTSYTNQRHTFRLHGREYLNGLYFVPSNAGLMMKDNNWHVMYAPKGTKHNTGLTGYSDGGYIPYNDGADYWIGDWNCNAGNGIIYPSSKGSSSSLGVGDMAYVGGKNIAEGSTREYLLCGHLGHGSGAGLLFVYCRYGLGSAWWHIGSRD